MSTQDEKRENLKRLVDDLSDDAKEKLRHYIRFLLWLEEQEKQEVSAKEERA